MTRWPSEAAGIEGNTWIWTAKAASRNDVISEH
jgi:hypothetical protein